MNAAAKKVDKYWRVHRSDYTNTLIYSHATSRTVPSFDFSLGSLKLPAPEAGDFVELILLHLFLRNVIKETVVFLGILLLTPTNFLSNILLSRLIPHA
jgi:hypothetical protein